MVVFPNCKINIGLNITGRRPDGFHNLETVFYPVPWSDILEIIPSDHVEFIFQGNHIDCKTEDNLCYKAYQLLKTDFSLPPIKLFLYKNLPSGAGLGGGSSDATFTLTTLNKLFSLGLNEETLLNYAARLGSDCAFFIRNRAVFATGRGEILSEISFSLKGYYLLIVKPQIHINTAEAFKMITPVVPKHSLQEIIQQPLSEWKSYVTNDFEMPVFAKHPELNVIKEKLYAMGAMYASMSGSGSALYGIFKNKIEYLKEFPNNICRMLPL